MRVCKHHRPPFFIPPFVLFGIKHPCFDGIESSTLLLHNTSSLNTFRIAESEKKVSAFKSELCLLMNPFFCCSYMDKQWFDWFSSCPCFGWRSLMWRKVMTCQSGTLLLFRCNGWCVVCQMQPSNCYSSHQCLPYPSLHLWTVYSFCPFTDHSTMHCRPSRSQLAENSLFSFLSAFFTFCVSMSLLDKGSTIVFKTRKVQK